MVQLLRFSFCLPLLGLLLLGSQSLRAQQLLWERASLRPGATQASVYSLLLLDNNQAMLSLNTTPAPPVSLPQCANGPFKPYLQVWDIATGTQLREQPLRNNSGQYAGPLCRAGSSYWWAADGVRCDSGLGAQRYSLSQRLSARADTLRTLLPGPALLECYTAGLLVQGNRVAIAGSSLTSTTLGARNFFLTLADTSGNLLSHHTYPQPTRTFDRPTDIARTPRGGYLLSGDGLTTAAFQHLLVETDSLGNQLKQRLIYPLGPDFNDGKRVDHLCNIEVLPNAGGYVVSGRADSVSGTFRRHVCYLMRLDTALNVTWVYRHPTSTNGNGVRNQYPSKVRLLPDGSLGFLVRNRVSAGAPLDLYLVQVDTQTGQHRATYTLPSPSPNGFGVEPFDWHWLPDSTLLLCGDAPSTTGKYAYLARWDFRQTPLATGRPAIVAGGASLRLYPSPATPAQPTAAHYQLPPGTGGGTLLVTDVLGRVVQRHPLPAAPRSGTRPLTGLPLGLYFVRLLPERGVALTQRLLVQP